MAVTVRTKAAGDAARLREVLKRASRDLRRVYRRKVPAGAAPARDASEMGGLVAVEQGCVIGVVDYIVRVPCVHVQGLAVHPQWRRRGAARALLEAAAEIGGHCGCGRLRLSTIRETGNVEIFVRLGFSVVREEEAEAFEGTGGGPVTQVLMERSLF